MGVGNAAINATSQAIAVEYLAFVTDSDQGCPLRLTSVKIVCAGEVRRYANQQRDSQNKEGQSISGDATPHNSTIYRIPAFVTLQTAQPKF